MLYAEVHFRFFRFFPSLLYKKEPEIIFDAPRRIGPGHSLPVVLIINEVDRFPVKFNEVSITVNYGNAKPILFNFKDLNLFEINHSLQKYLRAFIFEIPRPQLSDGEVFINAALSITNGTRNWTVLNDNLFGSSKQPFRCMISSEKLPASKICSYGDLHNHSIYSQSHVEFGPPLQVYDRIADVSGLQFLAITDHSYDLCCKTDNYLIQDQSLTKWKLLKEDLLKRYNTIMIQGEEISCLNYESKVVHLCGLGLKEYLSGTLDGARKNNIFNEQLTIEEAINQIHLQGGLAVAAHPGSNSGFMQKFFLNRGIWTEKERLDLLDGYQALNSGYYKSWSRAKSLWLNQLNKGIRLPLLGGNDAHGDFNRYRALSVPFIQIYEGFQRFMGHGKTGIYGKIKSDQDILNCIRNGATFITTGPYLSINKVSAPDESIISNKTLPYNGNDLIIHAISSFESGKILKLKVFKGVISEGEKPVLVKHYKETIYEIREPLTGIDLNGNCYLRAELTSILPDGETFEAFTSPCYFNK